MSENSAIEWCDSTWNPVRGCSLVSAGCMNCYAMHLAARFNGPGLSYEGLTHRTSQGPKWTGKIMLVPEVLLHPLRWKRPRKIFVNSMSDLFHDDVPDSYIDRVFAVMALCPQHTFQILTKRPERMRDYLKADDLEDRVTALWRAEDKDRETWSLILPLRNVWLGVSAEDQVSADRRIRILIDTPASVRWVSAEPLLGAISFDGLFANPNNMRDCTNALELIDWVVVGGESGPGARPMHPDWARGVRDQCAAAGVPFLFKQWGEWAPQLGAIDLYEFGEVSRRKWAAWNGEGWEYWEKPAWCDDIGAPEDCLVWVGKKMAGRLLDGMQHDGYPEGA